MSQTLSSTLPVQSKKKLSEPNKEKSLLVHQRKTHENGLLKLESSDFHNQFQDEAKNKYKADEKANSFMSRNQGKEIYSKSHRSELDPRISRFDKILTQSNSPKSMNLPSSEKMKLEKMQNTIKIKTRSTSDIIPPSKQVCSIISKKQLTDSEKIKLSMFDSHKLIRSPPIKTFQPIKLKSSMYTDDNQDQIAHRVKDRKRKIKFDLSMTTTQKVIEIESRFSHSEATLFPIKSSFEPSKHHELLFNKSQEFKFPKKLYGTNKQFVFQRQQSPQEKKIRKEEFPKIRSSPNRRSKRLMQLFKKQLSKKRPFSLMVQDEEQKKNQRLG